MEFKNPVLPGFYPDPSICRANGKYYLINSTFQYFPGIPIHESTDLVNWKLVGHVLTRESQLPLSEAGNSGGIFAPTIRFNKGRFYMVVTNVSHGGNFYVWTDDIYGEWSDPIWIDQDGIDPSFYFEGDTCYFMTNGTDDEGNGGIIQCEIDIETGKILTKKKRIWTGNGGRYLEGPHLYKVGDTYYLIAAEGGTEYGHMVIAAKGPTPYGPFTGVENNPILTNRNLGGYEIQGVGHADLIEDYDGNYWMVHLAYRQLGQWLMFHTTGRETYLVPVDITEDGISCGENGTTRYSFKTNRLADDVKQMPIGPLSFANTAPGMDWIYIRGCKKENYDADFKKNSVKLYGAEPINKDLSYPTFLGIRQQEMRGELSIDVTPGDGIGGISVYMDNEHHYDLCVSKGNNRLKISRRVVIGKVNYVPEYVEAEGENVTLKVKLTPENYIFSANVSNTEYELGTSEARYISTEVACGFTGVLLSMFAESKEGSDASCSQPFEFKDLYLKYE